MSDDDKLQELAEIEGFGEPMDMLEANSTDSVVPGICMNDGCSYTTGVEPDCYNGWCENCNEGTVKSCMILAGVI